MTLTYPMPAGASVNIGSLTPRISRAILGHMCGRYKHCRLIDFVPNCPVSQGAAPQRRPAYHFVFAPLADQRNFRPAKIKTPKRAFRDDQQCKACGLSMYTTEDHARAMVDYLTKGHKKALPIELGTHLACTDILATSGESTPHDEHGHYTFFEYANSNVAADFVIVGAL